MSRVLGKLSPISCLPKQIILFPYFLILIVFNSTQPFDRGSVFIGEHSLQSIIILLLMFTCYWTLQYPALFQVLNLELELCLNAFSEIQVKPEVRSNKIRVQNRFQLKLNSLQNLNILLGSQIIELKLEPELGSINLNSHQSPLIIRRYIQVQNAQMVVGND